MLKTLWIYIACLWGVHLAAETIGDVEFQFPPSNYDWNLFVDDQFFKEWPSDDEGDLSLDKTLLKLFTHREGDALELFIAIQSPKEEDDDDEEDEFNSLEATQEFLDTYLNLYLPNHKLVLSDWNNLAAEGFVSIELRDSQNDLMHGYLRSVEKNYVNTCLLFLTTAIRTESNRALWTQTLLQAR